MKKDQATQRRDDSPRSSPSDDSASRSKHPIVPFILTFGISFATWLVLSGKFDLFHLALGVICCLLVAYFSADLMFYSHRPKGLSGQWFQFVKYVPWLLGQVLIANWHVMKLVFHPNMLEKIDPKIITFRSRLRNDMSLFILANSITLTPGTITVYVNTFGKYTVHVIDRKSGEGLPGEMEKRVAQILEPERYE